MRWCRHWFGASNPEKQRLHHLHLTSQLPKRGGLDKDFWGNIWGRINIYTLYSKHPYPSPPHLTSPHRLLSDLLRGNKRGFRWNKNSSAWSSAGWAWTWTEESEFLIKAQLSGLDWGLLHTTSSLCLEKCKVYLLFPIILFMFPNWPIYLTNLKVWKSSCNLPHTWLDIRPKPN